MIDLTFLYVGTIESKIYLELLAQNDLLPKKIVFLRFGNYDSFIAKRENVEPKLQKELIDFLNLPHTKLSCFSLRNYETEIDEITIDSLADTHLARYLTNEPIKTFLYTGGGKVPTSLLTIKNSKFIHIHPGILPDIKGADCFLWSLSIRKKLGYSCFYMNEGIDTGDILYTKEYDIADFSLFVEKYDIHRLYKAILHYYDPVLRIRTFMEMLRKNSLDALSSLPSRKQNPNEGRTYFFMHPVLRNYVLQKYLQGNR